MSNRKRGGAKRGGGSSAACDVMIFQRQKTYGCYSLHSVHFLTNALKIIEIEKPF